jgi:hypothetical protein
MFAIKLMADYQAGPLWWAGNDRFGELDPASLSLSENLQTSLLVWAERFDGWIDPDDPGGSQVSEAEQADFDALGMVLWRQLQQELGQDYRVSYFSLTTNRLLEPEAK